MPADNDRVTVAVLKTEMNHLALTLQAEIQHLANNQDRYYQQLCKEQDDHEQRIRDLEGAAPWSLYRDLAAYVAAIGAGIAGVFSGK